MSSAPAPAVERVVSPAQPARGRPGMIQQVAVLMGLVRSKNIVLTCENALKRGRPSVPRRSTFARNRQNSKRHSGVTLI